MVKLSGAGNYKRSMLITSAYHYDVALSCILCKMYYLIVLLVMIYKFMIETKEKWSCLSLTL